MKLNRLFIATLAILCATLVGCNNGPKKPADLPKLNPTTIKIVYDDGTPVDGAQVALRLAQQSGGRTWNLTGLTDAQGKLVLKTDGNWDGAPAGSYQVMVTKQVDEFEATGDEVGAGMKLKSVTRMVSEKYNDPTTSGLVVEIKDGPNEFELKVGEKIEEAVKML